MINPRARAEAAKVRALLGLKNAVMYSDSVADECGRFSPEHVIALKVVDEARRAVIGAYDKLLELDRGVPTERAP